MKTYTHLIRYAMEQPWAVTPRMLGIIQGILAERLTGRIPSAEVIAGRIADERDLQAADTRRGGRLAGAVAVMPVYGVLMQRMDMMMEMSGGTSVEALARTFRALLNDPAVGTIVLDIDSPGGGVYGVAEFAEEVFRARGEKRIVAQANSMAASAAYWIATAADELVVTPGGEVGSIGVYMLHEDWSGAYEQAGVVPTVLRFGENKAEGIDVEPLGDAAREHFQARIDQYGNMFEAAVAKHRGVSKATVRGDFGQGMVFGAKDAVRLKLADRVATLEETIARLAGSKSSKAMAAFGDPLEYDPERGAWTASDAAVTVMTASDVDPEPVAVGTPALDIARLRHESEW
jgi:signal peptide peptidase SppA